VSSRERKRERERERQRERKERERETVGNWSASLPLELTGEWIALQHLHNICSLDSWLIEMLQII